MTLERNQRSMSKTGDWNLRRESNLGPNSGYIAQAKKTINDLAARNFVRNFNERYSGENIILIDDKSVEYQVDFKEVHLRSNYGNYFLSFTIEDSVAGVKKKIQIEKKYLDSSSFINESNSKLISAFNPKLTEASKKKLVEMLSF